MSSVKEFEHDIAKMVESKYSCTVIFNDHIPYTLFCAKDINGILGHSNIVSYGNRVEDTQKHYIEIDTKGGKQKKLFVTYSGLKQIVRLSRTSNSIGFAKEIGLDVTTRYYACIEADTIKCIMETFKDHDMKRQYPLDKYYVDLYFVDAKLAIECDEHHHKSRKNEVKDEIRQKYIESKLGCKFIRYCPLSKYFTIYSLLNEITNELSFYTEKIRKQKEVQRRILEEETNIIGGLWKSSCIYVFITNVTDSEETLLIGYCEQLDTIHTEMHNAYPFGKTEYVIKYNGIHNIQGLLESAFSPYKNNDVYKVEAKEAICIIDQLYSLFQIISEKSCEKRQLKISQICDYTQKIIKGESSQKTAVSESWTQTDFSLEELGVAVQSPWKSRFDQFIDTHCILHEHAEVHAKDIVGLQRLVAREAKQEITAAFTDYLKRRFKYDRLRVQNTDKIAMGYHGVTLKPIEYKICDPSSQVETFVFDKCVFRPGATALFREITEEYKEWKRNMKLVWSDSDELSLKTWLKSSPHVLFETVWTQQGNGQGFYGLALKRDERISRVSSTATKIEKRDLNNNVLSRYASIAKAAEEECMSAAKMSRCVKNRVMFDDYYYVKI